MKYSKTQVILYMFDKVIHDKELVIEDIRKKFNLEEKTFFRYILEIKKYVAQFYKHWELIYSRKNKKYIIQNKK